MITNPYTVDLNFTRKAGRACFKEGTKGYAKLKKYDLYRTSYQLFATNQRRLQMIITREGIHSLGLNNR